MKNYKWVLLTVISAAFSMITLAAITGLFHTVPKNGFARKFISELVPDHKGAKPSKIKGYIGKHDNRLWFSTAEVDVLYNCDLRFTDFKKIKLRAPVNQKLQNAFIHFIYSGRLYSWAPQVPALYEASLSSLDDISAIKLPQPFTRGLIIRSESFILRAFVPKGKSYEQAFIKYNSQTEAVLENRNVVDDLGDLGMLTDGMLHYDTANHTVIYVQYFSNNITWMDTNLNVLRRGHTIDTFSHARVSMEVLRKDAMTKKATFNAPPRLINVFGQVYKGFLFNYSAKRADNEEAEGYIGGSKIDVYSLANGKYVGTYKVPSIETEIMDNFDIVDGKLLAIYKNHIAFYQLNI